MPFLKYTLLSLMFLNNFPSMCQNISECAQLMNFIASITEPKHMCFDVLDFQEVRLFQWDTLVSKSFMDILKIIKMTLVYMF